MDSQLLQMIKHLSETVFQNTTGIPINLTLYTQVRGMNQGP